MYSIRLFTFDKKSRKTKKGRKTKQEIIEEESSETEDLDLDELEEDSEEEGALTLMDLLGGGGKDPGPEARSIMFTGAVTEEKAADLISALLILAQTKDKDAERADDIKLYISTYGGSADEMFGIYDVMNFCKQLIFFVLPGIFLKLPR